MLKISWIEHTTDEEFFRRFSDAKSFLKVLEMREEPSRLDRRNSRLIGIIESAVKGNSTSRARTALDYTSGIVANNNCSLYYELKRKAEKRVKSGKSEPTVLINYKNCITMNYKKGLQHFSPTK